MRHWLRSGRQGQAFDRLDDRERSQAASASTLIGTGPTIRYRPLIRTEVTLLALSVTGAWMAGLLRPGR
ncbi:hypothetical protein LP420_10165 [Massilia sp. B-10]|nr:hypothetical protein LP420_10165 [Massilia sp. B-10]